MGSSLSTANNSAVDSIRWISPKSTSGSMVLAFLAHAALYGAVLGFMALNFSKHEEPAPVAEEIAYETFDAPPAPAEVARPIARVKPTEDEEKTDEKPDTSPKELQDDKGVVAGTQTAAKAVATTGAEGVGDAIATPYYKIKPKYPRAALVSGVEGWVAFKIDVNEKGEVENVRVVGGKEKGMFQDEARRAVEKWKYKPFLDASGKPYKKTDHTVQVDFKLQDAVSS
jgi:periplasmic protein TonB